MAGKLKIGLAQIDPTVGDVAGNLELNRRSHAKEADAGCELVVCSARVVAG